MTEDDTSILSKITVDTEKRIRIALGFFLLGNFDAANDIARNIYDHASSMDVDSCQTLLMIFHIVGGIVYGFFIQNFKQRKKLYL